MQKEGGVGSKKLFENEKVNVWLFELEPGDTTLVHTHHYNYTWYTIQGTSGLQVFDEDDNDLGTLEVPTGAVFSLKIEHGYLEVVSEISKGARVPVRHKAKNLGDKTYREILVEYK